MRAIRQRIFACIFAVLFITVMASGGKKEVKAAERAGDAGTNTLVVYFSCTENTKTVAEHAANILNADIYEIVPAIPYTSEDLNYSNSASRTSIEQNDPNARPQISGNVVNLEGYETILIGYPIWWGQAPKIIYTFLESYDFSGKTILPFCTSASSPLGTSADNLHAVCPSSVRWLDGRRFGAGTSRETVEGWLSDMGFSSPGEGECKHNYIEEVTVEAGCTMDGEKTYTCSLCGNSYAVPIPAAHHLVTDPAIAAGCETEGKTEGSHCSVCNTVIIEQKDVPASGHHYKVDIVPATTKKDGSITRICTVCRTAEDRKVISQAKSMKISRLSFIYNGKSKKPGITIEDNQGKMLNEGVDYTIIYPENAKEPGIYKVTVQFRGNYSGTMSGNFTLRPQNVSISKLMPKKSGFSVKWKKQKQKLSGYEISYSTSRKFTKKTTHFLTIRKGAGTSKSVSKLKDKQKYYVRLRSFRTVKENGRSRKLYSEWSKAKTVRVKNRS